MLKSGRKLHSAERRLAFFHCSKNLMRYNFGMLSFDFSSAAFKRSTVFIVGLLAVAVVAGLDYATRDLSVVIFYLVPIAFSVWYGGGWIGAIISAASVAAWHFSNLAWTQISYSNIAEKLLFFLFTTAVLSKLKHSLALSYRLSRTDPLTGLLNRLSFYELLSLEIKLSRRYAHPVTLLYLDADNFKAVNDLQGHQTGDRVLRIIGSTLRETLRSTDLVARIGGDEFCVFLPETDAERAAAVCSVLHEKLNQELARGGWAVTVSIGMATFLHPPRNVDEVIYQSDKLMLGVKKRGKNAVQHEVFNKEPDGRK